LGVLGLLDLGPKSDSITSDIITEAIVAALQGVLLCGRNVDAQEAIQEVKMAGVKAEWKNK
jgi:hypothetical protein